MTLSSCFHQSLKGTLLPQLHELTSSQLSSISLWKLHVRVEEKHLHVKWDFLGSFYIHQVTDPFVRIYAVIQQGLEVHFSTYPTRPVGMCLWWLSERVSKGRGVIHKWCQQWGRGRRAYSKSDHKKWVCLNLLLNFRDFMWQGLIPSNSLVQFRHGFGIALHVMSFTHAQTQ